MQCRLLRRAQTAKLSRISCQHFIFLLNSYLLTQPCVLSVKRNLVRAFQELGVSLILPDILILSRLLKTEFGAFPRLAAPYTDQLLEPTCPPP